MKLGIVGKGGTGKTSLAALLVQCYAERGAAVLAIDTDSDPNLGLSLGLDLTAAEQVPVLPRSLVVGAGNGRLTPAELVGTYGVATPAGATLLHAARVDEAGAGCACGGHGVVRSLLAAATDEEADVTIVDMEAGLEHLSRSAGTLAYADVLLVVVTPARTSAVAARRARDLAEELGIPRIYAVGNRAVTPEDATLLTSAAVDHGLHLVGIVPDDPDVAAADRAATMLPGDAGHAARDAVADIVEALASPDDERRALLRLRDKLDARIAELQATGRPA